MVFTAQVQGELNLWDPGWLRLYMYQPPRQRFPGGFLRLGTGTFLLFTSGKVVINGVRGLPDLSECEDLLKIKMTDLKLSHMSAYLKVVPIDLSILRHRIEAAVYEPEIHPGLIFKINRVSVIAYHTGTILVCGCRSVEHCEEIEMIVKCLLC
jgi:TATA-box binding protein (TBP) (component of TFIID and TFIIIB)